MGEERRVLYREVLSADGTREMVKLTEGKRKTTNKLKDKIKTAPAKASNIFESLVKRVSLPGC